MPGQSFTTKYPVLSRILVNQVHVVPHSPNKILPKSLGRILNAQWDTGASGTVLSEKLVEDLGLIPISMTEARGCSGAYETGIYYVDVYLPNGVTITKLQVTHGQFEDIDVLIGMDIIGSGDFSVSNFDGKTTFSFRMPSLSEVDYNEKSYLDPHKKDYEPGRNDLCSCGSGKKYKNCCLQNKTSSENA